MIPSIIKSQNSLTTTAYQDQGKGRRKDGKWNSKEPAETQKKKRTKNRTETKQNNYQLQKPLANSRTIETNPPSLSPRLRA